MNAFGIKQATRPPAWAMAMDGLMQLPLDQIKRVLRDVLREHDPADVERLGDEIARMGHMMGRGE